VTSIDNRVERLIALDGRLLEAAEMAVEEAIRMISDTRTPSSAKAAVINTIFRSNGLLESRKDDPNAKEPHEMTAGELQQQIARLRREAADRAVLVIDAVPVLPAVSRAGVFE
jgi:hypothetical protein